MVIYDEYSRHDPLPSQVFDGGQEPGLAKRRTSFEGASNSKILLTHTGDDLAQSGTASRLDDLILYCVADDLADGMHLEFSHDIRPMSFGCLNAYPQSHSNLLAALALSKKLHDFAFPGRKPVPQLGLWVGY